jgi:hypothetical protein
MSIIHCPRSRTIRTRWPARSNSSWRFPNDSPGPPRSPMRANLTLSNQRSVSATSAGAFRQRELKSLRHLGAKLYGDRSRSRGDPAEETRIMNHGSFRRSLTRRLLHRAHNPASRLQGLPRAMPRDLRSAHRQRRVRELASNRNGRAADPRHLKPLSEPKTTACRRPLEVPSRWPAAPVRRRARPRRDCLQDDGGTACLPTPVGYGWARPMTVGGEGTCVATASF